MTDPFPAYSGPFRQEGKIHTLAMLSPSRWQLCRTSEPSVAIPGYDDRTLLLRNHRAFAVLSSGRKVISIDLKNPSNCWTSEIESYGHAVLPSDADTIIVADARSIRRLSESDGSVIWKWIPYEEEGEWIYCCPTSTGSGVFLGDVAGYFHCLDNERGTPRWSVRISRGKNTGVYATPLVLDDTVIGGSNQGRVFRLDNMTGKEIWRTKLDGPVLSRGISQGFGMIVVATKRSIYYLSPKSGSIEQRWNWPEYEVRCHELTSEGVAVVIWKDAEGKEAHRFPYYSKIIGLNPRVVTFEVEYDTTSFGMCYDGVKRFLYAPTHGGLGILDPASGTCRHFIDLEGATCSLPIVVAETIYMLVGQRDPGSMRRVAEKIRAGADRSSLIGEISYHAELLAVPHP